LHARSKPIDIVLEPISPDCQLGILDRTPRQPVEQVIDADRKDLDVLLAGETATPRLSLRFAGAREIKKETLGSTACSFMRAVAILPARGFGAVPPVKI